MRSRPILGILLVLALPVVVLVGEVVWALRGEREAFTNPSGAPQSRGTGDPLSIVLLGDSTAAGQGAPGAGVADGLLDHYARSQRVTLVNRGVSGARVAEVADRVVPLQDVDVVLLLVGANDVTHLASPAKGEQDMRALIETVRGAYPGAKVVVSGSPDMGSVPRFLQPLRWIAGDRTRRWNRMVERVVEDTGVGFARIAEETGPRFREDPSLFASDEFHPDARGYATWTPVLIRAIDRALDSSLR